MCVYRRGLDLKHWVLDPVELDTVYDLIAVTNHYGDLGAGHCESDLLSVSMTTIEWVTVSISSI